MRIWATSLRRNREFQCPLSRSCYAFFPKFTFSSDEGKCVPYVYGGCMGTENLYDSEAECKETCDRDNAGEEASEAATPKTLEVCSLPLEAGACMAKFWRFGFNTETSRCEKFVFGGKSATVQYNFINWLIMS